ncbi:Hypothetical protein SRAE_X000141500 [Strongyloides ratti]|uniref:K Homology domain-containing protein n=1 Tax=Strongyloides ratti TaxID=34506 RepID=A0A090KQL7_STRRB|nr:Hypothetical protein SRAE_X000141500 [Strongyloides ratti]CEF59669.1 Hypothetical protein SRAE_X000141500 [Strongyloides ratti]
MATKTPSIINNLVKENTFGIKKSELSVKAGYWTKSDNFNFLENNIYFDEDHLEQDPSLTTFYNDFLKASIVKAYFLPLIYQKSLEKFHKIVSVMILLEEKPINYLKKLACGVYIIRAFEIVKKIWNIKDYDYNLMSEFDAELKKIENIIDNMASNVGLKIHISTSTKILRSPKQTIVNMERYEDLRHESQTDLVTVYDDRKILIKKCYNCHGIGKPQFKMTKKIYFDNVKNVNIFGRILGPSGNTLRKIERLTHSVIHIRGSKCVSFANKIYDYPFETDEDTHKYVREPLHLLIEVKSDSEVNCYRNVQKIKRKILKLLDLEKS